MKSPPDHRPAYNQASAGGEDVANLLTARDAALRAARTAVHDTTRLTRLLTILSEPAPLNLLLDRVLSALSELFSADIVVLLDPAGTGTFSPLAAIGLPEEMIHQPMSSAEDGYVATTMSMKAPVMTSEVSTNPHVDIQLRELEAETAVWLPVIGTQSPRGVLILARCRPAPFAHADADLLSAMAYRIGLALEQAQRSIQLEKIVQAGREIGRHLDESQIGTKAVRLFPEVVNASASALILTGPDGEHHCEAQLGLDTVSDSAWSRLTEYLLVHSCLAAGEPYAVSDLSTAIDGLSLGLPVGCPVRALLAVPIMEEDLTQGVLYAMRFSATSFSPDTIQVALLCSAQISAALENARLYRAVRDELAERVRAEQALRQSDERFRALIRSVSDVIAILTSDGTIRYASPAVVKTWGYSTEALLGKSVLELVHPEDTATMRELLTSIIELPNTTLNGTVRLRQGMHNWGSYEIILANLLDEPAVAGIVATYHDVTKRMTFEQKLTKLAFCDPLTGLANRTQFRDRLQQALVRAKVTSRYVAVIFFDLDNFKLVNDTLGHACGDHVLNVIAERIRACLRRHDTAARFGGDEFTVLVEEISGLEQVMPLVERLNRALLDPIHIEGRKLLIGGSIGIAISDQHNHDADDLLRKADLAMYHAKSNAKGAYAIFDPDLNTALMKRFESETKP